VKPATSFFPNGETQRKQKRRTTVRVTLCPARRLRRGSPVRVVVVVVVVAIILQRREKIHHRRLLGFDGHFARVSREKQISETDVLSLVARKSVVSSGASRECARGFLFKTTAFRVFLVVVSARRGGSFLSNDDSRE
jgi:hypothetical protein